MSYMNFVNRFAGIAALGIVTGLGVGEAFAQDLSTSSAPINVYAPPPPSSSVYRPAPSQPHVPYAMSSRPSENPGPIISETTPWWELQEGRLGIFAGLAVLMIGLAGGIFWVLHRHGEDEGNGGARR